MSKCTNVGYLCFLCLNLYPRNVVSGTIMTVLVRLLHPYFMFLLMTQHLGILYTTKQSRCPDVVFIGRTTAPVLLNPYPFLLIYAAFS